jgi:tryptophan-rich hypothetical protein
MGMVGLGQEIEAARLLRASLKPRNFVGDCMQAMVAALPVLKQRSIPDEPSEPQKMLLTKWTAVKPVAKQKHFLVRKVIQPELPTDPIELVEIEAVFFKATQIIAWRQLQDDKVWRQGWV